MFTFLPSWNGVWVDSWKSHSQTLSKHTHSSLRYSPNGPISPLPSPSRWKCLSKVPEIKNVQKAILGLSYSTGACAIEYEILIAFTYDNCWHQDREMRSEKKQWKKIKRNKEWRRRKESFFKSGWTDFIVTCCVLLLNVLLIGFYSEHVIAFGT